jgi:hypothetical protein
MHLEAIKTTISIEKIISDGEKGIAHWDYYNRWQEFKNEWSAEDRSRWNEITGRMHKDVNGRRVLEPSLTGEEKSWLMSIALRAMEWGFC